jgi:hypothetical protein
MHSSLSHDEKHEAAVLRMGGDDGRRRWAETAGPHGAVLVMIKKKRLRRVVACFASRVKHVSGAFTVECVYNVISFDMDKTTFS